MSVEEHEVAVEIVCTKLPGSTWDERGVAHLGIQKEEEIEDAQRADLERIQFRPTFRVRRHTDGSANFLGPFAHGPRASRFIYLVWTILKGKTPVARAGRIKLMLDHIEWRDVERAAAKGRPMKVTIALTDQKGRPVYASVRADRAKWDLQRA